MGRVEQSHCERCGAIAARLVGAAKVAKGLGLIPEGTEEHLQALQRILDAADEAEHAYAVRNMPEIEQRFFPRKQR